MEPISILMTRLYKVQSTYFDPFFPASLQPLVFLILFFKNVIAIVNQTINKTIFSKSARLSLFLFWFVFFALKQWAGDYQICCRSITCSWHVVQDSYSEKGFYVDIVRKRFQGIPEKN